MIYRRRPAFAPEVDIRPNLGLFFNNDYNFTQAKVATVLGEW